MTDEIAPADPSGTSASDVVPAPEPPRSSVLALGVLFVAGLLLGLVLALVAPMRTVHDGTVVPWGLVLAVVTLGVAARGGAWLTGTRSGAAILGLGWLLPTLAFLTTGPGGDVLMPAIPRTWWYLGGSAAALLIAIAWPLPKGARELAEARRSGLPDPVDPTEPPGPAGSAAHADPIDAA